MKSKHLFIGLGAAALIAALLLVWQARGSVDGQGAPTALPAADETEASAEDARAAVGAPHRGRPQLDDVPVANVAADELEGEQRTFTTEDGREVTDHRKHVRGPLGAVAAKPVVERTHVERATLGRIRLAMRPAVKQCAGEFRDLLEERSKLQVELTVDIADEVATTTALELDGVAVPPELESCVRDRLDGLSVDTPGAADAVGYSMTSPFMLGKL